MNRMRIIAYWTAVTTIAATTCLAGERVLMPSDVFYYQPAASVFGAEAAWVNPAGLSRFSVSGYQLMADEFDGRYAKSWGTVVHRKRLSFAYRNIDNPSGVDFQEFIYAGAFPVGRSLHFGTSYRWFKEGPGILNRRHFWNIGLSGISGSALRWGVVLSNLNRGKIDGLRSQMEQRYSLSYRPLGPDFTISTDMMLATGTRLRHANFVHLVEYVPRPGLIVNAQFDNDGRYQFGLRVNLLRYFVGSRSRFSRSGRRGVTTAFVGATSLRQPSLISYPQRRLAMAVTGRPAENPVQPVFGHKRISFLHYLMTIYRAANDSRISDLRLDLKRSAFGLGQAQELRDAISYFRSRGKSVVCHLTWPNNISYFVASAANKIVIPPVSQLRLVGLRAELTFLGGTLDKIGVDVDLVRIGKYKSAAESLTRDASTAENRNQVNRLLDDLYAQFVEAIAQGRGLSPDSVREIIDGGPYTSQEAMQFGLVDGLSYADDQSGILKSNQAGISIRKYMADTLVNDDWRPRPAIAVVVAEGEIGAGGGGLLRPGRGGAMTPAGMNTALKAVRKDHATRAVILRINSPGGSALAGEEIHHWVALAAEKTPVVVSMANVAASGGYYVATPAQRMFASPATITGSIGIFGGKVDYSRLYDKIGLGKELYTRGAFAGMLSSVRPFTDVERKKYLGHLQAFYDHFVSLVSTSRGLAPDSIDALARGRVWTGREALANGLVDEMGGLKQSIDYAAEQAGLEVYDIKLYPTKRPLFVLPGWSMIRSLAGLLGVGGDREEQSTGLFNYDEADNLFTRMPYDIRIE